MENYKFGEKLKNKTDNEKVEILIHMLEEKTEQLIEITMENQKLREYKEKMEMQWMDDLNNPLEPLKLSSALQSELFKLEFRKKEKPKEINILDYTIIAALKYCIENTGEIRKK